MARRLRGVEGRAAADRRVASGRQPAVGGHGGEPVRLREDRPPASSLLQCPRPRGPLYHAAGWRSSTASRSRTALRVLTAPMPHAQSVSCVVMLGGRLALRDRRDERDRPLRRAHVLQGHRAAPDRARPRRPRSTRSAASSTPSRARSTRATTSAARPRRATSRSTCSSTCSATRRFDPEEIEREKGVIIEEMNMYFDTPRDFIGGVYEALLYGDQPLGWDIIGRKETIRAASRETFTEYLDHWYRPDRMVVGVGGPDRRRPARAARGAARRPRAARDRRARAGRARRERLAREGAHEGSPTRRTSCSACAAGRSSDPDRYVLQLLATVLGGGMSSRLFTEVRERRGLGYYVFGTNHAYTDAGSLYAQSGVDINRIDDAVTTIVEQFELLAAEPVPRRGAREGAQLHQGALRAPAREPARHDHVRPAPRGARGTGGGAAGGARGARRGHGRGRPARRRRDPVVRASTSP